MGTVLLLVCFLVIGAMASNVGLLPAQVYWNTVLPNTQMPAALSDILSSGNDIGASSGKLAAGCGIHIHNQFRTKNYPALPKWLSQQFHGNIQDYFFLEQDLYAGSKMNFPFKNKEYSAKFLPKTEADSIPFSSNKLPQIINRFSVQPGSDEEEAMKYTLTECEAPTVKGEKRMCATSLESLVDFGVTSLGTTNLKVVSTTVHSKIETPMQQYTIVPSGVKKLAQDDLVACHEQPYPYAVLYCHMVKSTKVYTVKMTGKDGTVIDTVAVCHTDTSEWNPKHVAFEALKVKPGTVPVCHFLCEGNFVFIRNNYI